MQNNQKLDLEALLIDRLQGKLSLLQPQAEREITVLNALEEILREDTKEEFRNGSDFDTPEKIVRAAKNFLSYGIVDDLLCDSEIEDIVINSLKTIYVHHAQKGFVSTEKRFQTHKELDLFVRKLLLLGGRNSQIKKILNLELPNLGGRVNIAMSSFGPQLTITKARLDPLSILDLINRKTLTFEVAAQLWLYLEGLSIRPANIIITGGPGTGKTTLLNALFSFVPETDRMVIIEDTLELNTFLEESCSRLESDDDLSLADLVKNSLRMRPERIVIGEVRGAEAQDMITAANVGKYCISTIHALTSREAILRLQNEPMNVPEVLVNLIDVFVVLKRYHVQDKLFRVIDEVSESSGMEQRTVLLSQIFKYDYEQKNIRAVSTSTVFRDRLAQQSGLIPKDIIEEVSVRAFMLKTLHERNLTTMKEVTTFCRAYNKNPRGALASLGFVREKLLNTRK